MRTDKRVKERYPFLSNSQIDEAISLGLIKKANGSPLKKGEKYSGDFDGEILDRAIARGREGNAELAVVVVFENDDYWVVDKPSGVASHPLKITDHDTLTHWAIAKDPRVTKEFPEFQPTITPHRLDTDTSGIVIVAKNRNAFAWWRERFTKSYVTKYYLAWCWGSPPKEEMECHSAIAHDPKRAGRMVAVASGAKHQPPILPADSFVRVVRRRKDLFLAEVRCTSGVTHQVRVHLASLGFPLVGDTLYDDNVTRGDSPGHHLLRAAKLIVDKDHLTFQVDTQPFEELFS